MNIFWQNKKMLVTFLPQCFLHFKRQICLLEPHQTFLRTFFQFKQMYSFGWLRVNPLPDDKILDWSRLKQIADILKSILNKK